VSEPGKSLVVADYGQLELRLLAHITDCESMLSVRPQSMSYVHVNFHG
jgi:DNA polymerase I-like protein with 3'-5' exonuclease and polymerase domains